MKSTNFLEQFVRRHNGVSAGDDLNEMLHTVGVDSLDQLVTETIPDNIRLKKSLALPKAMTENEYLQHIRKIANRNVLSKNYIGMGYYETITPSVILRNIFENPGWYTQYTPYQAEISQGRLEALMNFQTMVADLTGLPIANASLLDEGTAAAEAMHLFYAMKKKKNKGKKINVFLVDEQVFPQTIDVLRTRAESIGIELKIGNWRSFDFEEDVFGMLLQYPGANGKVDDFSDLVTNAKEAGVFTAVAADLLSLAILTPPAEWGADIVLGNTQRMGVPMGLGGPHAAYFAAKESFKRLLPGRIIGLSKDVQEHPVYRMALQTREQHIRREKATSNICTAQALLAIMAGMYGVWHGEAGLRQIAGKIHHLTNILAANLRKAGFELSNEAFFDTLEVKLSAEQLTQIQQKALKQQINLFYLDNAVRMSVGEGTNLQDIAQLVAVFGGDFSDAEVQSAIPDRLRRTSRFMMHPVFEKYQTETMMMRYLKRLENKDISLMHSMISLGSCTMKLNAATELIPVSWPEFSSMHPFAPSSQIQGYQQIFDELEAWLSEITGFSACSLQPNSGAQGEFTGLMCIRAYHHDRGDDQRNIALIPSSAHGTNPASAVMAGMKVVVVACDNHGNIDLEDLEQKAIENKQNLSALMVTYPSTHGVFEVGIKRICEIIHENGGLVYMDGANMNAQVGFTSPGEIGADVCHLNLHKTFAIPHGGGGPGVGPICVNDKLKPYLPGHCMVEFESGHQNRAVSSGPWGSANVVLISHAYIQLLGTEGLEQATRIAILNANYIKARLEGDFDILYAGDLGRCAHELIVDLRPLKAYCSAEDVAKRLMDYSFHAPTLSFPVPGTIMIEPTESESKDELDRFCDVLLMIRREIQEIADGVYPHDNNVLHNAPHTSLMATSDEWNYPYSREKAVYPLQYLKDGFKVWPAVARINNAYGDRNLVCTCPPLEDYVEV